MTPSDPVTRLSPPRPRHGSSALARAAGSVRAAAVFAPVFAVSVAAIVAGRMLTSGQAAGERFMIVVATAFVAAALAGGIGWIIAAAVAGNRPAGARFAAMLVVLPIGTAGFIAFGQYLAYVLGDGVSSGDDPAVPSLRWVLQNLGGAASAAYVTVAVALRLLLPLGLAPLLAGSLAFVRFGRSRSG
jgi:hypothetical protein